jgi:hypothetical protein
LAVSTLVALGAGVAAIVAPIVAVLWIVVVLNILLGERENVPFSRYAMFSMPASRAWALRFEDLHGELIAIRKIGLAPHVVRKRFETELNAARAGGVRSIGDARFRAASVLAGLIEQHRPPRGPLSDAPIRIVLTEYVLDSGRVVTIHSRLVETTPR